ncbi:MAG: hypothetical protein PHY80_03090, partial [Rickettsiales bacterium]|nr:hypothetical protein [Rickettsiales bacterium]
NPDPFTIGCISKCITGAGILLFSQDVKNDYLFQGKDLEITIGELLKNRKKYLESLQDLTSFQREKLNYINNILSFASDDVLNSQVYKILNHTSFFADDFDMYFLYSGVQSIINLFPNHIRNEFILIGIQVYSSFFRETDSYKQITVNGHSKYSNMGFMYISFIMSLMTEKESFFEEIKERIFSPLGLENKIIPANTKNQFWFKEKFPNQNYANVMGKEIKTVEIYKLIYTEMDTLNAGLLSNLKSVNILMKEIAKMYFDQENKLSKNSDKISKLFFEYKNVFEGWVFYSLGAYIDWSQDKIRISATGNVFKLRTQLHYSLQKTKSYKEDKFEQYQYKKENYNDNIEVEALVSKENSLLNFIFFKFFIKDIFGDLLKNIITKSVVDLYYKNNSFDNKALLIDVNYRRNEFINKLRKVINRNIDEFIKNKNEKSSALQKANDYLILLENFSYQKITLF